MRKKGSENYCHNLTLFIKCRQGGGDGNGAPKVVRKKGVKSIPPSPPPSPKIELCQEEEKGRKLLLHSGDAAAAGACNLGLFNAPPPSPTQVLLREKRAKNNYSSSLPFPSLSSLISQCAGINNQEERGFFSTFRCMGGGGIQFPAYDGTLTKKSN